MYITMNIWHSAFHFSFCCFHFFKKYDLNTMELIDGLKRLDCKYIPPQNLQLFIWTPFKSSLKFIIFVYCYCFSFMHWKVQICFEYIFYHMKLVKKFKGLFKYLIIRGGVSLFITLCHSGVRGVQPLYHIINLFNSSIMVIVPSFKHILQVN